MINYLDKAMELIRELKWKDYKYNPEDYEFRVTDDVYENLSFFMMKYNAKGVINTNINKQAYLYGIKVVIDNPLYPGESYIRLVKKPKAINYSYFSYKYALGRNQDDTVLCVPEAAYGSITNQPWKISDIDNVIFNDPATIVFWKDGSKTVVKCSEDDTFDKEKGLAMAIIKKMSGNDNSYHKIFKKWCVEKKEDNDTLKQVVDAVKRAFEIIDIKKVIEIDKNAEE